jgi:hypothetical protein
MRYLFLVAASAVLLACRDNEPAKSSTPPGSAAPAATAAAIASPEPAASSVSPAPSAVATASSSASAAPSASVTPPSAIPTHDEWQSAVEVKVKGSTALGCETKRIREWLGVFCAKPNDANGTPVQVTLQKAEVLHAGGSVEQVRREVQISSAPGATSLVARYVPGTDVEATFSWTDKEKHLTLWWPDGKPEPLYQGAFK